MSLWSFVFHFFLFFLSSISLIGLLGFCCPNSPFARHHDQGLISHHLVSLALSTAFAFLLSPGMGRGLGSPSMPLLLGSPTSTFCHGCFFFEGILSLFLEEQSVFWHPHRAWFYTCPRTAYIPADGLQASRNATFPTAVPAPRGQAASRVCAQARCPALLFQPQSLRGGRSGALDCGWMRKKGRFEAAKI